MNVARAPSPAKVVLGLELRVHPQPAIIFRLLNQPCLYRILSDVFAFLLQTLIRPQHMIEGFLFPDRTGSVKQLIDTMSSRALQTLQNVHERIRPALFIAEWQEKHMDVVGHDYGCIEMNPCGAGALARERLDAPSRRQCSRTKSRASSGNARCPPVQNVTNIAASAFCKCGSRLR